MWWIIERCLIVAGAWLLAIGIIAAMADSVPLY
jgi:hypothetical protein